MLAPRPSLQPCHPMTNAFALISRRALCAAAALSLLACSKNEGPAATTAATPPTSAAPATQGATPASQPAYANTYEAVAAKGKGFTVGAMMSAQPVYVLFDPQCPHCGRLWQASHPLMDRVKFVWIPIAFNAGKSLPQAGALLSAADPVATMDAHEALLLAGKGGMEAPAISPELEATVRANTQLLNSLGADSVPFVVIKNRKSGEVYAQAGALPTEELAAHIGLN